MHTGFEAFATIAMIKRFHLLLAVGLSLGLSGAGPVTAGVENEVRERVLAGEIMPFETIRKRVVSQVRGDYIGAEFDAGSRTYRFRFLVSGQVINVDVDARTGQRARSRSY